MQMFKYLKLGYAFEGIIMDIMLFYSIFTMHFSSIDNIDHIPLQRINICMCFENRQL
jgi:hypothetical protein